MGDSLDAGVRHGPSRGHATFLHELRAGAGFHILTAVTSIQLRPHVPDLGDLDAAVGELGPRGLDVGDDEVRAAVATRRCAS